MRRHDDELADALKTIASLAQSIARVATSLESIARVREVPEAAAPAPERVLYSIDEAAELCGIGRTTVFQLISEGRLRTVQIGRRRLVPRDALEEFIRNEAR